MTTTIAAIPPPSLFSPGDLVYIHLYEIFEEDKRIGMVLCLNEKLTNYYGSMNGKLVYDVLLDDKVRQYFETSLEKVNSTP